MTVGEEEHRQLMEMLAQSQNMNEKTGSKLSRSRSDITEEQYAATRNRLRKMEAPLLKWMDKHSTLTRKLKRDIVSFNRNDLKSPPAAKSLKKNLLERKNHEPLR